MLPLFKVMGKKSLLCGSYGSGQATKACNNMLLATTMIGVGEAFNLGMNLGLDPNKLYEIISTLQVHVGLLIVTVLLRMLDLQVLQTIIFNLGFQPI